MRIVIAVAVATLVPAAASAQSMNAEAFHQRATALKAKGPLALLERSEIDVLVGEAKGSGQKAEAARQASLKAKHKPRFCPAEAKYTIGQDEFMNRLGAIPLVQRRKINMTEAMTRILAAKYPCKR